MIWEIWWAWVAFGIGLAILEIFAPGFLFLGFAIGAVVIGVLVALGFGLTLAWLLVTFALVSVIAWVALRQVVGIRRGQRKTFDSDINEE